MARSVNLTPHINVPYMECHRPGWYKLFHKSNSGRGTMTKYAAALLFLATAAMFGAAPAAEAPSIKKLDPALDSIIAPGTKVQKVAGGFIFVEGPMWKEGRLWFSDVRGDK